MVIFPSFWGKSHSEVVLDTIGAACTVPGLQVYPVWALAKYILEKADLPKHNVGERYSAALVLARFPGPLQNGS